MGVFSDKMTVTARNLLTKFGQSVSWSRYNPSAFDADTGEVVVNSTTNYSGVGYPTTYKKGQVDGTIIQANDIMLLLSTTTAPENEDVFTLSGVTYTCLNVAKITAQGNNIIYKIQLRQ